MKKEMSLSGNTKLWHEFIKEYEVYLCLCLSENKGASEQTCKKQRNVGVS